MLPTPTVGDLLDCAMRDTEKFGQFSSKVGFGNPSLSNKSNSIIVQLRLRGRSTLRCSSTSLPSGILHIVGPSSLKQVSRIAARWVVATMTNIYEGPQARTKQISYPMRAYFSALFSHPFSFAQCYSAVRRAFLPFAQIGPACFWRALLHFIPESLCILFGNNGWDRIDLRHGLKMSFQALLGSLERRNQSSGPLCILA